jgi:hypothetical protein
MKKALSLVVILTLLCFPVSGFCSVAGGIGGAIVGVVAAPTAAIAVGTVLGGLVVFCTAPAAGVIVAFSGASTAVLAHILGIAILGGVSGAIEGARGGHPLIAGVYGGMGVGVALGAF